MDNEIIMVDLESPFAGRGGNAEVDREENLRYARACMRDCLLRGEFPIASHLLYTQPGILDDDVPEERALGIRAGKEWGRFATKTVVYTDRGISVGMEYGIKHAEACDRPVEYRSIDGWNN